MPSKHSSSSHSSSSRSSSSFSSRSSSFSSRSSYRPSNHSSSSHSSITRSSSGYSAPSAVRNNRNTSNLFDKYNFYRKPVGYDFTISRPKLYRCEHHNYIYYPLSWTDTNGNYYNQGYYDENGQYYKELNKSNSELNSGVVCTCPYCNNTKIFNWNKVDSLNLVCDKCGGQMEVTSTLDKILEEEEYYEEGNIYDRSFAEDVFDEMYRIIKSAVIFTMILVLGIGILPILRDVFIDPAPATQTTNIEPITEPLTEPEIINNTDYFGTIIYLKSNNDGSYSIVDYEADKRLIYDSYEDSYYDADNEQFWLWYNTDVFPHIWQYWYEPISSNYEDYGWMEHDVNGWWIEESDGNWKPLSTTYADYEVEMYYLED